MLFVINRTTKEKEVEFLKGLCDKLDILPSFYDIHIEGDLDLFKPRGSKDDSFLAADF